MLEIHHAEKALSGGINFDAVSPGFGALKQNKREIEYVRLESERPDLLRQFEQEKLINDKIRKSLLTEEFLVWELDTLICTRLFVGGSCIYAETEGTLDLSSRGRFSLRSELQSLDDFSSKITALCR